MASLIANTFEFDSIDCMMDFIRPLVIEGYTIATKTVFRSYPRENSIEKFVVHVSPTKKKEFKITVEEKD